MVFFMYHVYLSRWPAMVEEDPDKEAYYEFGKGKSNVPVSDV